MLPLLNLQFSDWLAVHADLSNLLTPVQLRYPYDDQVNLKHEVITFTDGFTADYSPILYRIKDITLNKSTLMILTSALGLNDILDKSSTTLSIDQLEIKINLIAGNNKYVRADPDGFLYADTLAAGADTFLRIKPTEISAHPATVSIWFGGQVLTVSRTFPFDLSFQDELTSDPLNKQKFDFFGDGNIIRLKSKAIIGGAIISRFLSFDPLDSSKIKLCGDDHHNYEFTLSSPQPGQQLVQTNFDGSTYWIKYFNSLANQENNKSVEINMTESISAIPVNLLALSPYETLTFDAGLSQLNVNLNVLKNFQTPEYEYTDNNFDVGKYIVSGYVRTVSGDPLPRLPLVGLPLNSTVEVSGIDSNGQTFDTNGNVVDVVTTDENGFYSGIVNYDWVGTFGPYAPEYQFDISSVTLTATQSDIEQDFTAISTSFVISGTVFHQGTTTPAENISIFAQSVDTTVLSALTDANGIYYIADIPFLWTGFVIPSGDPGDPGANIDPSNVFLINVESTIQQNFKILPSTRVTSYGDTRITDTSAIRVAP